MNTESKIQSKIIQDLENQGYYVLKLIQTNKPGIPDLLALKQNEVYFVEVKTDKGKANKLQLYRHKELEKFGFKVEIKKQV